MPPSLHTGQLRSLRRFRCLNASRSQPFSTSSPLSAIGPENPKFIEIPTTRQPHAESKPVIKGTLPPPRDLFPTRGGNKTSSEYFEATAPAPTTNRTVPANEHEAWKRAIAENRRKNLMEGLVALEKRKRAAQKVVADRSKARSGARRVLLAAPQREDERLTTPTVMRSTATRQSGALPDPHRQERIAAKVARVRAKEAIRHEARRDALHTLYMNARSFITTEQLLEEEIERIFIPRPFPESASDNIWDAGDHPPTVQALLANINNTQKKAVLKYQSPSVITGKRMQKIAEELTGGKMD